MSTIKIGRPVERAPMFQGYPNRVMNWVKYHDRMLIVEIPLGTDVSRETDERKMRHTKNMSIATCLLLSWKLLMYALETLFVASERTP